MPKKSRSRIRGKRKERQASRKIRTVRLGEKAKRVASKFVRFGKRRVRRGKYVVTVQDQHGRKVGEVPWRPSIREDVREALAAVQGEAPPRLRRALRVPGWETEAGSYDPDTGTARWTARVFAHKGIPIGVPGGRTRGRQRGRLGKYLGEVFENVDPWYDWAGIIGKLPARFQDYGSNIRARATVRDRDGNVHVVMSSTPWFPGTLVLPQHYRALLADALSRAGQLYGYAGAVELTAVDLVMASEAAADVERYTDRPASKRPPRRKARGKVRRKARGKK